MGPTVSVILVSRNRPQALARCLTGLGQLRFARFEIVLVCDSASLAGLAPALGARIKAQAFDSANISAARNLGIGLASGEIVAFIDDDAVPEPGWLAHLTAPFADASVSSAGGYVRGRNGISFQWRGQSVDAAGRTTPLPAADAPLIVAQTPGRALKTEGTNMAFRREDLIAIGGFDPGFRFYLDETDVNLRMAARGGRAALVPLAEVHHGFAASAQRRADRVPLSLHEVGASMALFLRKHLGHADPARLGEERALRRRSLIAHMVAGRIEPRDVDRILDTLAQGWTEGLSRESSPPSAFDAPPPFLAHSSTADLEGLPGHLLLSGPSRASTELRAEAAAEASLGKIVSLYLFSPGLRYHHLRFDPAGYWLQTGGLHGRSLRDDPLLRRWRHEERIAREAARVAPARLGRPGTPV